MQVVLSDDVDLFNQRPLEKKASVESEKSIILVQINLFVHFVCWYKELYRLRKKNNIIEVLMFGLEKKKKSINVRSTLSDK